MTTTNKKIISIIGIVMVLATVLCCTLVGCSTKEVSTSNPTETNLNNDFAVETNNTEYVKLAMGVAYAAAENGSVSKEITATVLPATAANKAVDWSVEWGDSANTATVTDYVTVSPDSDGSTHAIVTCHQAFSGTIIVTVTTRESGYTASCNVSFVGIPTDMIINGAVSPSGDTYALGIGQTYTFNVGMTNPFNSVGASYNNITCTLSGVGSVVLGYMEHYNSSGTDKWYDTSDKTVTLDSIKDNFITATYADGKITITTIKSIESYYATKTRMDGGRTWGYDDKFRSFVDDCYFKVIVTENNSGFSKEFNIRFDTSVVTGVNASISEMTF